MQASDSSLQTLLFSLGIKPLDQWDKKARNGHIKRVSDNDIRSKAIELLGLNVSANFITCPPDSQKSLGITKPHLVMIVKNMKKYFTFEVQILDDTNTRRRFQASTFRVTTDLKPTACLMPLQLDDGWNQVHLDLAQFTKKAFGTKYVETIRVQIHANCRLRRIYFADRLYLNDELPDEFKLIVTPGH